MARTAPSPEPGLGAPKPSGQANGQHEEISLDINSLVETLRDKLEAGQGECIYKLNDLCKSSDALVSRHSHSKQISRENHLNNNLIPKCLTNRS